eukprot:jgi/Ulvmu1/5010/UM021_0027.1
MEAESTDASPATRARDSLIEYIDIIKAESSELVSQLKQDSTSDLDFDWDDIKAKIRSRKYTIYGSLNADVQKILDHVLAASKRNNKQRGSGTMHKNIKRNLDKYERYLRGHLYIWHPKGKEQAAKEEKAYREKQWAALEPIGGKELHAQLSVQMRALTAAQQRNRDGNITEVAARILETSQDVKSTHGFGADPLAVNTWLQEAAPRLAPHATDDFIGSDEEHAGMAATVITSVDGATAVRVADGQAMPSSEAGQEQQARLRRTTSEAPPAAEDDTTRATEWKARWLQLRIAELSFLERHLETTIATKLQREEAEIEAAQDSPWLAGKAPRQRLPAPAPVCAPGFTADALRAHPFFGECAAAVASGDAGTLLPPPAGAVQEIRDDQSTPAAVHWALVGLQSSASALAHYISTETGQVAKVTTTAAPSKVPKKAMPRQRSSVSLGGIALARRNSERKPGHRRDSVLPEDVVEELTRRPPKPYIPQPRTLTAADIAARAAAESSGEDEPTSDSYYLQLHDLEQAKKEQAEREAGARERERERRSQRPTTPGGRARSKGATPLPAVSGGAGLSNSAGDALPPVTSGKGPISAPPPASMATAQHGGATASSAPKAVNASTAPGGSLAAVPGFGGAAPPAAPAASAAPAAAPAAAPSAAPAAVAPGTPASKGAAVARAPRRGQSQEASVAAPKRARSIDPKDAPPKKRASAPTSPAK